MKKSNTHKPKPPVRKVARGCGAIKPDRSKETIHLTNAFKQNTI